MLLADCSEFSRAGDRICCDLLAPNCDRARAREQLIGFDRLRKEFRSPTQSVILGGLLPKTKERRRQRESDLGPLDTGRSPEGILSQGQVVRLLDLLAAIGMIGLGSGDDALVYAWPESDWVLRISQHPQCFSDFVEFVENHRSEHLPRVFGHHDDSVRSVTIMERLYHPRNAPSDFWRSVDLLSGLARAIADERHFESSWYGELPLGLRELAFQLGKVAQSKDYALDFGVGNILTRDTELPVIVTDPWFVWAS